MRNTRGSEMSEITNELIAEAKKRPGGWVYEIVGDFGPHDEVPPSAIRGAWQVDLDGNIVGEFQRNPNFTG